MGDGRRASFRALYNVLFKGAYSNIELNRAIKAAQLDRRDSALASAIFYGVPERKLTLERKIRQYSSVPLRKIEDKVLIILEQALYQMLYLDKIPDSAAVNEAVKAAKSLRLSKSSGFINGVLRSFLRAKKKYKMPDSKSEPDDYLSVKYSCPKEIIEIFKASYGGEKAESILSASLGRPPVSAAMNTLKTTPQALIEQLGREGVSARVSPLAKDSIELSGTGSIEELGCFKRGELYIQDEASQLASEILNPQPKERLIDVCAAPGGKSFKSAIMMQNRGEVCSFDLYPHKTELIEKTAERLGISIIRAAVRDALKSDGQLLEADRVICDVPCSGLGVLRRKPEIKYKNTEELALLPKLQYGILINSSRLVKKGGVLLYSTCTLNKKENNDICDKFLSENKGFEPLAINPPDGVKREIDESENCLTLFPSAHNTDGFFVGKFIRCE